MAIIKEWRCLYHGDFESSHPICPADDCDSEYVDRVFLTAPGIRSKFMTEFDRGIRKSAEGLNLSNFRSAREGESAHGGNLGAGVLWGSDATRFLGADPVLAVKPFSAKLPDGRVWTDPGGMRQAAQEVGITKSVRPKAELTTYSGASADAQKVTRK
jgi:hypothetical protein